MNRPPHTRQLSRLQVGAPHFPNGFGDNGPVFPPGGLPTPGPHSPFNFPNPPHMSMHRSHPSMQYVGPHPAYLQMPPPGVVPGQNPMFSPAAPGQQFGLGKPNGGFNPRQRRNQSVSIGGPPKAVLGGPQRKPSPLPPNATPSSSATPLVPAATPEPTKPKKKYVVRLPVETITGEGSSDAQSESALRRAPFARYPLPLDQDTPSEGPDLLEISSRELISDILPLTPGVSLPGKVGFTYFILQAF